MSLKVFLINLSINISNIEEKESVKKLYKTFYRLVYTQVNLYL